MNIDLKIGPEYDECKITISSPEMNEEIEEILSILKRVSRKRVIGFKDDKMYVLNPEDIFFFCSANKKVFAQTETIIYEVKEKLYELEEELEGSSFVRISKSVIANIDKIKNLEMFFNGTMCVKFTNGSQDYVSRKYVSKIKKYLCIGGK